MVRSNGGKPWHEFGSRSTSGGIIARGLKIFERSYFSALDQPESRKRRY
jgi:hypothetical protein